MTVYTGVVSNKRLVDWGMRAARAMAEADRWSAQYEDVKAKIEGTKKFREAPEYNQRLFLEESYELKDAGRKYTWFAGEAQRLNTAIIAQDALRRMLGQKPTDGV